MPVPGEKYCRLTLVEHVSSDGGHAIWKCLCDCGNEKNARLDKLKAGRLKSCGCLKEDLVEASKKARSLRITEDQRIIREAGYARDQLKLKTLLKQKGRVDFKNFNLTGSPRQIAREFREWAFIVAAVLWHGPTDDSVTITANVKVGRLSDEEIQY